MTMMFRTVRSDTLPENTRYADDGCEVSRSCLDCPLPICKYDDPGWLQRQNRRHRDDEIFRLRKMGMSVPELARRFKVSTRTVHRVIQRGGSSESDAASEDQGPAISLDDLAVRTLFRERVPFPELSRYPELRPSA
jgi:hypothetical protein